MVWIFLALLGVIFTALTTILAKIAAPKTTNGERKNNLNVRLIPVCT